jgi:hypothetical protein
MKPEGKRLSRGFTAYDHNSFLYHVGRAALYWNSDLTLGGLCVNDAVQLGILVPIQQYRQSHRLSFDKKRITRTYKTTRPTILLLLSCVFVAAVTFLLSRCLATYTYIHRLMGGIYEVHRWDGLRCHDIYTVSCIAVTMQRPRDK